MAKRLQRQGAHDASGSMTEKKYITLAEALYVEIVEMDKINRIGTTKTA